MFNFDRRLTAIAPRLRFITDEETAAAVAAAAAAPPTDLGFPAETPIADMTETQELAYFKHHSRRHEAAAAKSSREAEAFKADSAELAALRTKNLSEDEKAIATARAEARAEGRTEGASQYLNDAIQGRLLHLTGRTEEELDVALELIDVNKLVLADGSLDIPKITAYAATLATKSPEPGNPRRNPAKESLDRQSGFQQSGSGGSIAEAAKLRVAELNSQNKK